MEWYDVLLVCAPQLMFIKAASKLHTQRVCDHFMADHFQPGPLVPKTKTIYLDPYIVDEALD